MIVSVWKSVGIFDSGQTDVKDDFEMNVLKKLRKPINSVSIPNIFNTMA